MQWSSQRMAAGLCRSVTTRLFGRGFCGRAGIVVQSDHSRTSHGHRLFSRRGIRCFRKQRQHRRRVRCKDGAQLYFKATVYRDEVRVVAFSRDEKTLAAGSRDGVNRLWHLPDFTENEVVAGDYNAMNTVDFSFPMEVSYSEESTVKLKSGKYV